MLRSQTTYASCILWALCTLLCSVSQAQPSAPNDALPDADLSLTPPELAPRSTSKLTLLNPASPDNADPDPNASTDADAPATSDKNASKPPQRRRRVIKNGAYLLYFYEHDPIDDESFLHVLGLYWRRTNPDWKLNILVPFGGVWEWKQNPKRWGFITPLAWHISEPDYQYTGAWLYHSWSSEDSNVSTIFPLYWNIEDTKAQDDLHIFANGYFRSRPEGHDWGFLPLAWGSTGEDRAALTVLPLFSYDETNGASRFISLFYTHHSDPEQTTSSIPLLLTMWTKDENTTSLYNPLFFFERDNDRQTTSGTIPLLLAGWEHRAKTATRQESLSTYQFPFWYSETSEDESFYWFTPTLTFEYSNGDESFAGVFPVYFDYHKDDDEFFTLFLPFLYANYSDGPDETFTMLGPLYHARDDEEVYKGLFPLYFAYTDEDTDDGMTLALPLYYALDDGPISQRLFLPLLYGSFADKSADTSLTFAGPYYNYKEGQASAYGVAPLFFHKDNPDEGTSFNLVPGLWYSDHAPDFKTDQWGPIYRHTSQNVQELGVFPFVFYRNDATEESRELFISPMMYFSDGPGDDYASVIGPAWSTNDGDASSHGLAPIFMYETYAEGGHLLWLPGFLDIEWHDEDSTLQDWHLTWFLTGLRFGSRQGTSITAVAPLFLSMEDRQERTEWTFALPWIYTWSDRRNDERTVIAPPFYYNRDADGTFWTAGLIALGYEDAETDWWAVAPLVLDIYDKTDDTQYTFGPGLFGRISKGNTALLGTERAATAPETFDLGWIGPFVWADNNDRRFRLLAPLFVDYRNTKEGDSFTALLPLWMRWQDTTDRLTVRSLDAFVPLYVHYTEDGPNGERLDTRTAIGPLFGYNTDTSSGFGLAPLFWHDRTTDGTHESGHDILFPIMWSFFDEADDMSLKVLGPLYSYTDATTDSYGIAPLHFAHNSYDPMTGIREGWSTTVPLYWRSYTEGPNLEDNRQTIATPIGFHRQEGASYHGLWLNHWYSASPQHETDVIFPFYFHHSDMFGHFTGVVPFYFEGSSPVDEWSAVFPFYYAERSKIDNDELVWAFPYLGWHDETSSFDSVPPLFFQSRNDQGDLFRLITPLLFLQHHDSQDRTRFTSLGPVWHHSNDSGAYDTGIFPLAWWGRGDGTQNDLDWYAFLAPLLWLSEDKDDFLSILGPFWLNTHPDGHSGGLIPLAFWHRDDTTDTNRSAVLPLYYYMGSPEETAFYSLLYSHEIQDTKRWHLAPLFFHSSDDTTQDSLTIAGPLVWNEDESGDSFTLFPLYWSRTQKSGWERRVIFPLYYGERGATGDELDVLFPVGLRSVSADGKDSLLIAGPYIDSHSGDDWMGGVAPLYLGGRDGDGSSWNTVLGLYWDWDDPNTGEHGTIAGPLYTTQDEDGTKEAGLFPIAGYSNSEEDGLSAWLLPVAGFNRSTDGKENTVVAGPVYYHSDETEDRTDFAVLPLIWGHSQGETSSHTVLPAYHYEGREDGHTFISPVAYSHRESDVWRAWSVLYAGWGDQRSNNHILFPLFYSATNHDGSSLDLLLPFYARVKRPGNQSGARVVFPLYWEFYNMQAQSSATVLFPLYWHFTNRERELRIIAPWFMSERKDGSRKTHGLVPLYYYSEDRTGYTFNVLGGFFGVDHTYATKESEYQLLWIPF